MNKEKTQVMVVEDEGVVALDIRRHLEKFGYEVTGIYPSGEEALERYDEDRPDLVLMDIRLQGEKDGLETTAALKEHRHVPVILLTAYADEKTVERAKTVEPFGYIIKPFEERELRTTIEMALYRHHLESRLARSEERYRRFFMDDLSADFVADAEGNFIICNESFVLTFGYESREEAERDNISGLFPDKRAENRFWNELMDKRRMVLKEMELERRDNGKTIVLLANIVGSFSENRRLEEIKGYLLDISKRRDLEQQLRQAQKLEAIGRLAGGVAHDFNNILTVIMGYSTMVKEKLKKGDGVSEHDMSGIEDAAKRASTLTRQLLAFSRRQVLKPKNVHLSELVRNIEKMVRRLIHENISMNIDFAEEEEYVYVDPGQVEQVLINLVVNARDAMLDGGELTIRTGVEHVGTPFNTRMGKIPPGSYVVLHIGDTGVGMSEETQNLIFEPFYTTKSEEKGTGLGLSTVYGIVKQSGGYIYLYSEKEKGTSFTVYFPISTEISEMRQEEGEEKEKLEGKEHILVVEDEESVRRLTLHILNRYGYSVRVAANPQEALEICDNEEDSPFDLLVTDVIMPYMDGNALAKKIRKRMSTIKILYMSGYPQYGEQKESESLKQEANRDAHEDYISKPFEPAAFIYKIRSLLDSS